MVFPKADPIIGATLLVCVVCACVRVCCGVHATRLLFYINICSY